MRDRLIELLTNMYLPINVRNCLGSYDTVGERRLGEFEINGIADHLLTNGVIVPPCKVGDTVYYIEGAYYNSKRQTVRPIKVTEISWKCDRSGRDLGFALIANSTRYKFSSIGKTVFLTKELAEKALAERSEE
jgi:hypothetical protein